MVSFVLVLGLVGEVQAGYVSWTDAGPDHLWGTPTNWGTGTIPPPSEWPRLDILPGPIIKNEDVVNDGVVIGLSGNSELTVDCGTLTVDWLWIAQRDGSQGTLNMISGTLTVGSGGLYVGKAGVGTVNMTGGTITVDGGIWIAQGATAKGHMNLHRGIITANGLQMGSTAGSVATLDVAGGTLILNGDYLSTIQGYIDSIDPNLWITAYDGNGTLQVDYDVTNKGKTTLKAIHNLKPNPADGALVSPGAVELSWTLPDPCVPGQPVPVDVYFTDDLEALQMFTDPESIQVVSKQNVTSVVVQTQTKTRYYWAVDAYIGDPNDPIFGPIFSFFADNAPPEVDAGKDVVTWLIDGVRTSNLDGTVTDDGALHPYTVQWTVVSEPNDPNSPDAVITDPAAEDTTIILSAVGEYVLQLEAFDGEYTGSDTVTINVYNDGCEAAQSLPDYEPFPGDLNGDCKVDDVDMALLQEDWLKDNSLTEEIYLD